MALSHSSVRRDARASGFRSSQGWLQNLQRHSRGHRLLLKGFGHDGLVRLGHLGPAFAVLER